MKMYYYVTKTILFLTVLMMGFSSLAQHGVEKHVKQANETSGNEIKKLSSVEPVGQDEEQDATGPRYNREWTILETYPIEENASGLAWDGEYLYFGIYGSEGDRIYRVDPSTGDYELHLNAPIEDAYGLTFDGAELWTVVQAESSGDPSYALQFDLDGNEGDQFTLPAHYMSGIAYDDGDFWSAAYYDPDGYIYKTDNQGNILDEFAAPDNQPWDLAVQDEYLWMADKWGNALYKIDKATGDLLETHSSEHSDPSGITWDGQYLWYLDKGSGSDQDWLYKVDLSGSGSPVINVPVTSHNYGLVNIGDSETWEMTVENNGQVDLTVEDLEISDDDITTSASFPITIAPEDETTIPITYSPEAFGEMETTVTVVSNDPLNSEVDVSLSGAGVFDGPTVAVGNDSHNYGTVRVNSTSRWYIEIINQGDEVLSIENVSVDNGEFYFEQGLDLPIDISVLGSEQVGIWFQPPEGSDYSGTVTVTTNDASTPNVFIDVEGTGDATPLEIGDQIWDYTITTGYDNSAKAFEYLPDLNGDNQHEVLVASEDNYIRCLNGNADGDADVLWETEIYSGSLYHQHSIVTTGDLDGDEYEDIIVGTIGGDQSVRAISGKDGSFIWQYNTDEYGDGGWVYQVFAKYDYNDDGTVDALAATGDDSQDNGPKRIFCIDGTNGDVIWDKYAGGPAFSVIGVPDFTGDGLPDVVAGASNESESQGRVIGINGENGSEEWSYTTSGSSVWALELLSDINDDDINDVIAGDFGGDYYLLDATDGSVIADGGIGNDLITWFDRLDDVNGDGYWDIAPAHSGSNMVVIDGKTGDYVWSAYLADQASNLMAMEDVNGDLVKDIAVGTLYSNNVMYIIDGSNGDELMSESYGSPIDGVGVQPDVVGDGSWEAIAGGRNGQVTCYSGGMGLMTKVPSIVETSGIRHQVAPNPLSQSATISFVLDSPQKATIDILNLEGVKVTNLANRRFNGGVNKVKWNADVASGVYFYRIQTGGKLHTGKVVVR